MLHLPIPACSCEQSWSGRQQRRASRSTCPLCPAAAAAAAAAAIAAAAAPQINDSPAVLQSPQQAWACHDLNASCGAVAAMQRQQWFIDGPFLQCDMLCGRCKALQFDRGGAQATQCLCVNSSWGSRRRFGLGIAAQRGGQAAYMPSCPSLLYNTCCSNQSRSR